MADETKQPTRRKGRAVAQPAPRPTVRPAPDHDRDPAVPAGAVTEPSPAPARPEKVASASPAPETAPPVKTPARSQRASRGSSKPAARPATTAAKKPEKATPPAHKKAPATEGDRYPNRLTLPLDDEDYTELKIAQVHDRINTVRRLRAMVDLWRTNARFRAQVDKHARNMP